MGLPVEIFVDVVHDCFKCAICFEVLDEPQALGCGHEFCASCLEAVDRCPTCRKNIQSKVRAFTLKSLIDDMEIRCRNNALEQDCSEPPRKRQSVQANDKQECCTWKLVEWQEHCMTDCMLHNIMHCEVAGCKFFGTRKELEAHTQQDVNKHLQLMLDSKMAAFKKSNDEQMEAFKKRNDEQMEAFKKTIHEQISQERSQVLHLYLSTFCRQWVAQKPDPLYDFVVYRGTKKTDETSSISALLCGIPGPKGTPYHGGLFPVFVEWRANDIRGPAEWTFPKGFFHLNAKSTGRISLPSTALQSPLVTIQEALFVVQHVLAHPDPSNTWVNSNTYRLYMYERDRAYEREAKGMAEKYTAETFLREARGDYGYTWTIVENENMFPREEAPPEPEPTALSEQSIQNTAIPRGCTCSWCSWAASPCGRGLAMCILRS